MGQTGRLRRVYPNPGLSALRSSNGRTSVQGCGRPGEVGLSPCEATHLALATPSLPLTIRIFRSLFTLMAAKKRKLHSTGGGKRKRKSSSKGKRPDVSRKKSEARFFLKSATKCTLGRFSKYQEVTDEIHACVYWMSRLMVHACHVMTLLVLQNEGALWCCGEENVGAEEEAVEEEAVEEDVNNQREKVRKAPPTLYGLYNKVMRTLANFLQGIKERKGTDRKIMDACEVYARATGIERGSWPRGCIFGWRGKVLEEMARQLSTNHKTHLENNLFIFAKRYLKYLTRTNEVVDTAPIEQLGTKAAYNKVVSAIEHAFWKHLTEKNGSDLTIEAVISGRPKTLEALPETHAVWPVAQLLLDHMKEFVPRGTTLSDKSKIMFDMMRKLEPFAEALQRQFQEGGTRPPGPFRGKSKIRFCLVPQADWRPKHILISSTALGILLTQLSRNDPDLKRIREALEHAGVLAKGASDEDKYKLWDALFDMRRVLRKKHLNDPSQLRFGNFIATDGVSVSACMMTKKSPLQCKAIELKDAIEQAEESGDEKVLEEGKAEWKKVDQEIKARNDGYRITERVQQLVALEMNEDGTIVSTTGARIVGLDPGKKSAATWVVHDPAKQAIFRTRACNYANGFHNSNSSSFLKFLDEIRSFKSFQRIGEIPVPGRFAQTFSSEYISPLVISLDATSDFRLTCLLIDSLALGLFTPSPSACSTSRITFTILANSSGSRLAK